MYIVLPVQYLIKYWNNTRYFGLKNDRKKLIKGIFKKAALMLCRVYFKSN